MANDMRYLGMSIALIEITRAESIRDEYYNTEVYNTEVQKIQFWSFSEFGTFRNNVKRPKL